MDKDKTIRKIIERLYCNCNETDDSIAYNDYLALKAFANSIGGEVYTSERNMRFDAILSISADYLPYGKYQLRFKNAAKLFMDKIICESVSKLKNNNSYIYSNKLKNKRDEYFICKSCCPVCKDSARGCPLHCCNLCWKYLSIMSKIEITRPERVIKNNKHKIALINNLNEIIKSNEEFVCIIMNGSQGYLHNLYDVIVFMYLSYDYNDVSTENLIKALLRVST